VANRDEQSALMRTEPHPLDRLGAVDGVIEHDPALQHELDRAARGARRHGGERKVSLHSALAAEAAAHIGRGKADILLADAKDQPEATQPPIDLLDRGPAEQLVPSQRAIEA
jgi:hypothetical protein